MKNKEVLIILGAPNSPTGVLSNISKERLEFCFKIFKKGMQIICTGGWGTHFNTAEKSHAFYTKNYLVQKGISENSFLDFALSKNTVEDAVKVKEIITQLTAINLTIITSDYHLERVKLIFSEILKDYKMSFYGVKCRMKKEQYDALIAHEKKAINEIVNNGLYY